MGTWDNGKEPKFDEYHGKKKGPARLEDGKGGLQCLNGLERSSSLENDYRKQSPRGKKRRKTGIPRECVSLRNTNVTLKGRAKPPGNYKSKSILSKWWFSNG